ncbi:hypothetical protein V5O48_017722 [Marasmius crinis-equi]|uniref:Uncharacterized protein n=1 Tax=Marasmius crinis-equi TaxID=585013 RepID=A0ABR3ENC8_9AGAR
MSRPTPSKHPTMSIVAGFPKDLTALSAIFDKVSPVSLSKHQDIQLEISNLIAIPSSRPYPFPDPTIEHHFVNDKCSLSFTYLFERPVDGLAQFNGKILSGVNCEAKKVFGVKIGARTLRGHCRENYWISLYHAVLPPCNPDTSSVTRLAVTMDSKSRLVLVSYSFRPIKDWPLHVQSWPAPSRGIQPPPTSSRVPKHQLSSLRSPSPVAQQEGRSTCTTNTGSRAAYVDAILATLQPHAPEGVDFVINPEPSQRGLVNVYCGNTYHPTILGDVDSETVVSPGQGVSIYIANTFVIPSMRQTS